MTNKPTPSRWSAEPATGSPGRYVVQRTAGDAIQLLRSASGRVSVFRSYTAASDKARRLNKDEAIEAELRAKYANQPKQPTRSLGQTIAKAIGR